LNWATSLLATQVRVSQHDYFILFGMPESLKVKIIYYVQGVLQNKISDQTFQKVNKWISETNWVGYFAYEQLVFISFH